MTDWNAQPAHCRPQWLSLLVGMALAAAPASATVLISQVYGGGGNGGAPLKNDFIELFNNGASAVDLSGWSVQYASASGTSWQKTALGGMIQPGQYLLVQQAAGTNTAAPALPAADFSGSIAMGASNGKVALVKNNTALNCSSNCLPNADIADLVGYGSAGGFEGSGAAPAASNTQAVLRGNNGCNDSNNNAADFSAAAPAPRNAATPFASCSGNGGDNGGNNGGGNNGASVRIRDIQGKAHLSPLLGRAVTAVPGVVTLLRSNGFYMQDTQPDNDAATSEGIFVYTGSAPTVAPGDAVSVSGSISEFRPGGSGGTGNLSTTQIGGNPQVSVLSSGNALPAAVVIGAGGRTPPGKQISAVNGNVENAAQLDLSQGIDFWESLEGMRLQLNQAVATGPRNSYGEVSLLADAGAYASVRNNRGALVIAADDFNPERIILDDGSVTTPVMNSGDMLTQVEGVLDYNFGNFKLLASHIGSKIDMALSAETTRKQQLDELSVASFNVENLDAGDDAAKFSRLAQTVVGNLQSPDIVGLMEIQDDNGATNNGVVSASQTYARLIAAISAAGGPAYQFRQIDPVDGQDGGEPGGNIRVGFLFNPLRVTFVDRAGAGSLTANTLQPCDAGACLQYSPGRIAPSDSAFASSRKPLAGEFRFNGHGVIVIANHFNSKGGDQPLFGRYQPPALTSETQRQRQAEIVANFVQQAATLAPQAKVVVLGDLNDFQFSRPLSTLKNAGLADLVETLPEAERYTYIYDGNAQVLDHIMVSQALQGVADYDIVHVNSEFADQASDHEPEVARLNLPPQVSDISSQFGMLKSGLSYNFASKTYNGTLTLTASAAINKPLLVALRNLPAGVSLANAWGYLSGVPYLRVEAPIAAGQKISLPLRFNNPAKTAIGYQPLVYVAN